MTGSEKQIKWAEAIKVEIKGGFDELAPHPIMDKAKAYIMDIDSSSFWIEEARPYTSNPVGLVMAFAKAGILLNGSSGDKLAKINQETGEITVITRGL